MAKPSPLDFQISPNSNLQKKVFFYAEFYAKFHSGPPRDFESKFGPTDLAESPRSEEPFP